MDRECLLAIRLRGEVNIPTRIRDTLRMLRMDKKHASTLLDNRSEYIGMLQLAKDCITWGEPTVNVIQFLLLKRGKVPGDRSIDEAIIKKLGYSSSKDLATKLYKCEVEFNKIKGIKPFFRLHPPRKGFKKSVKRPYRSKGELGYRGESINELVKKMC